MTKEQIINRLHDIAAKQNNCGTNFRLEVEANDWQNYGKDRTYFQIVETCESSKHYKVKKYGYFDNIVGCFVGDENAFNFTFSGAKM